jgi:hypothetical protein
MVIKVEVYYELSRKSTKPFPDHSRVLLNDKVKENFPKRVVLTGSFWEGDDVVATLLTQEQLLERIRTAK